jgi:E3 ubiquitin-protein ligase NEDD4
VKDSSVVAVQIFDQRKFKRKSDQGFLGVINIKVSDVIDLELGGQGESSSRKAVGPLC